MPPPYINCSLPLVLFLFLFSSEHSIQVFTSSILSASSSSSYILRIRYDTHAPFRVLYITLTTMTLTNTKPSTKPYPPPDRPENRRLLPNVIDELARSNPDGIWSEYPVNPTSYSSGFKKVTNRQFANAVDGTAWWLEKTWGKSQSFETLPYMGPNDMRYIILVVAAVKVGYKVCFLVPSILHQAAANNDIDVLLLSPKQRCSWRQSPRAAGMFQDDCIGSTNPGRNRSSRRAADGCSFNCGSRGSTKRRMSTLSIRQDLGCTSR